MRQYYMKYMKYVVLGGLCLLIMGGSCPKNNKAAKRRITGATASPPIPMITVTPSESEPGPQGTPLIAEGSPAPEVPEITPPPKPTATPPCIPYPESAPAGYSPGSWPPGNCM